MVQKAINSMRTTNGCRKQACKHHQKKSMFSLSHRQFLMATGIMKSIIRVSCLKHLKKIHVRLAGVLLSRVRQLQVGIVDLITSTGKYFMCSKI